MSNIYDEAIKEVKNIWNGNELTYPKKTIEALERAKKVEELLEDYKYLLNIIDLTDLPQVKRIKELEKELEEMK
jgi:hypothetical protein